MPSSPSALLNVELQATGENLNTWGGLLNGTINRLTEAIAQITTVPVTSPTTTLTSTNFAANQARSAGLLLTGALTANTNIVAPSQTKIYLISNATTGAFTLTINTVAGTPLTLRNGSIPYLVYCDGTNFVTLDLALDQIRTAAANVAMGTHKFTGMLKGSVAGDSASLDNALSDFLGAVAANIPMAGFTLTGLPAATTTGRPVTFANSLDQLAAPAANVPFNSKKITGLADGSPSSQDVASVNQVQNLITAATIPAGNGMVKIDGADTTSGYLGAKLLVSGPLTKTINNVGGNETITLGAPAKAPGDSSSGTTIVTTLALINGNPLGQPITAALPTDTVSVADATTYTARGLQYLIKNMGQIPFPIIRATDGKKLGWAPPGWVVSVVLSDNSTANGVWQINTCDHLGDAGAYLFGRSWQPAPSTTILSRMVSVLLDDQYGIIFWANATYRALGYKIAASGISFGTVSASLLGAVTPGSQIDLDACRLTATTAFVSGSNSTTNLQASVISLNTGTLAITEGTPQTVATTNIAAAGALGTGVSVYPVSSTLVSALYNDGTAILGKLTLCSIAGTAITVGSTATLRSSFTGYIKQVALSASLLHVVYGVNTSSAYTSRVSIAGTVPTAATAVLLKTGSFPIGLVRVDATHSAAIYADGIAASPQIYGNILTDTGSTITLGTEQIIQALGPYLSATVYNYYPVGVPVSDGKLALIFNDQPLAASIGNTGSFCMTLTCSASTITASAPHPLLQLAYTDGDFKPYNAHGVLPVMQLGGTDAQTGVQANVKLYTMAFAEI